MRLLDSTAEECRINDGNEVVSLILLFGLSLIWLIGCLHEGVFSICKSAARADVAGTSRVRVAAMSLSHISGKFTA